MIELKTIESERYEKMEDQIHVKQVGMIQAKEAFQQLKDHLEKVGLLPDEYFIPSFRCNPEEELPDFNTAICHTDWGSNEGIYLDIALQYTEDHEPKLLSFATGKTLDSSGEAFLRMSRIAAECSMMLNGRGFIVKVPERFYENVSALEQDFSLSTPSQAADIANEPNHLPSTGSLSSEDIEQDLLGIAQACFPALENRHDLRSRNNDREDFFEVSIWGLRDALTKAYEWGCETEKSKEIQQSPVTGEKMSLQNQIESAASRKNSSTLTSHAPVHENEPEH